MEIIELSNELAQALKGYQWASRAATALKYAQIAAMGCAAASLVAGGVRVVKRLREE